MYVGHPGSPQFYPIEPAPSIIASSKGSAGSNSDFTFDTHHSSDSTRLTPIYSPVPGGNSRDDEDFWNALLHENEPPAAAASNRAEQRNTHLEAEIRQLRNQNAALQQHTAQLEQRNATLIAEKSRVEVEKNQMQVKMQLEIAIRTIYADEILKQQAVENAALGIR